jgi:hypothetical protein
VTIRPADDATEVPDSLYAEWRVAIAAGAKVYVRTHYEAWDNPAKQDTEQGVFDDAVIRANHRRAKGGGQLALRTRAVFF